MRVYLTTKFKVSSTVLTNFRKGVIVPPVAPSTAKQIPKKTTQIRIKANS